MDRKKSERECDLCFYFQLFSLSLHFNSLSLVMLAVFFGMQSLGVRSFLFDGGCRMCVGVLSVASLSQAVSRSPACILFHSRLLWLDLDSLQGG